jgi:hypothetical protein
MCKVRSILELGKWEIGKFAVSVTSWTEGDFPISQFQNFPIIKKTGSKRTGSVPRINL